MRSVFSSVSTGTDAPTFDPLYVVQPSQLAPVDGTIVSGTQLPMSGVVHGSGGLLSISGGNIVFSAGYEYLVEFDPFVRFTTPVDISSDFFIDFFDANNPASGAVQNSRAIKKPMNKDQAEATNNVGKAIVTASSAITMEIQLEAYGVLDLFFDAENPISNGVFVRVLRRL